MREIIEQKDEYKPRGLTRIATSNCSCVHMTPNIRAYGSYMSIIAYLSVVKIIEVQTYTCTYMYNALVHTCLH